MGHLKLMQNSCYCLFMCDSSSVCTHRDTLIYHILKHFMRASVDALICICHLQSRKQRHTVNCVTCEKLHFVHVVYQSFTLFLCLLRVF